MKRFKQVFFATLAIINYIAITIFLALPVRAGGDPCIPHTNNGDGTCTASYSTPTEVGYISYDGGFYVRRDSSSYTNMLFGYEVPEGDMWYRGYAEWDITSLPDGVDVIDTLLRYEGAEDDFEDSELVELMSNRPTTETETNLFNAIGAGTAYVSPWNPTVGTDQEIDLGTTADSDVETQMTADWFGLGFLNGETQSSEIDEIVMDGTATPRPTLVITYQLASEPTTTTTTTTTITSLPDTATHSYQNSLWIIIGSLLILQGTIYFISWEPMTPITKFLKKITTIPEDYQK